MQSAPMVNLIEWKRAATLITKGPQSESRAIGAIAVDHFLSYPVPIEEYIEIIAFDIHTNKIQQQEQHCRRLPVIVIVVKYLSIVASDNPVRSTNQGDNFCHGCRAFLDGRDGFFFKRLADCSSGHHTALKYDQGQDENRASQRSIE
jgi:hypothetical protein